MSGVEQLVQKAMKDAGFKEGTPEAKVKSIILGKRWNPRNQQSMEATNWLYQHFLGVFEKSPEELYEAEHKSGALQWWGYFYGLESCEKVSDLEKKYFKACREELEEVLKKEHDLDVKVWGNPLHYTTQPL